MKKKCRHVCEEGMKHTLTHDGNFSTNPTTMYVTI